MTSQIGFLSGGKNKLNKYSEIVKNLSKKNNIKNHLLEKVKNILIW